MKRLTEKISNPIVRVIIMILLYIAIAIILIPAIPYAMIKGAVTTEYYEEWLDFIYKYIYD